MTLKHWTEKSKSFNNNHQNSPKWKQSLVTLIPFFFSCSSSFPVLLLFLLFLFSCSSSSSIPLLSFSLSRSLIIIIMPCLAFSFHPASFRLSSISFSAVCCCPGISDEICHRYFTQAVKHTRSNAELSDNGSAVPRSSLGKHPGTQRHPPLHPPPRRPGQPAAPLNVKIHQKFRC